MAVSFNSYLAKPQDATLLLDTGEVVSLRPNDEVFDMSGHLKGHNRLTAGKESHWFTLSWPRLAAKHVSTLSKWRLVITKATDDRITSFYKDTAANLGSDNWNVVKSVVADCRAKFHARLLSMSNQEIVFSHEDQQSAEKMKNSNQMVDIMNTLLAHVDNAFCDILVDWEVKVTPVTVSLSYQPFNEESDREFDSVLLTDADSPSATNSTVSRASTEKGECPVPEHFHTMMDMVAAESQKTRLALERMAKENSNRHRIICQKMEELKSSFRQLQMGQDLDENDRKSLSEPESDQNDMMEDETTQEEEDSIPSVELFREPRKPAAANHEKSQGIWQQHGSSLSSDRQESTSRLLQREDTVRPSVTHRDSLSGSALENKNLDEAVELAYQKDVVPPPTARSYSTILCLDISASMADGGAFEEMKKFVEKFIDGVEDVVNETGIEENIGLVTFGSTSTVVQNVTNDFSRVRDALDTLAPGGRSPFVQALLVSMAALVDKAGVISVSRVYDVRPRIIFVSDGLPTENYDDGGLDYAYSKMHVRTGVTRLMMNFATKDKYAKVHPVVYVPVGRDPDRELMRSMAKLSNGVYLEPTDVDTLCAYYMVQETIGKTLACVKGTEVSTREQIEALATGLTPGMTEEQKAAVVGAVQKEQTTPSKKHRNRLSDMDDIFENTEKVDAGEMLPLGTRVLRGPEWRYNDQDGQGPGTVFSHRDKDGWTWVNWDNGSYNRYPFGPEMGYHIWKTEDLPRFMDLDEDLEIGMTVEKGPDWSSTEKSLQNVQTGVVIRKSRSKRKLMVRWDTGQLQVVRYGSTDKYDVMYCDPAKILTPAPLPGQDFMPAERAAPDFSPHKGVAGSASPECEHGLWQQKGEDGSWVDYPPEQNACIEKNYKRKPDGSCVIQRDGTNRRVMFRRKTEKVIDSGVECAVQRIPHPDYNTR
ncbi:uncharacterized protein [Littorina saxatilis]|uniref:uncharacterized protein n=1 Tax=Littorina saxatilis TaxID=31220 RepID=UPI0038B4BFA3